MTSKPEQPGWVIADVWESIAATRPDTDAIIFGAEHISWSEFDHRADAVAADLLGCGLRHQSKVAFFVRNSPAFLIGVFACLKAGFVPVNTNFRYGAKEAASLWDDADAECVIFSGSLSEVAAAGRPLAPRVGAWRWVDDQASPCPSWAGPFEGGPFEAGRQPAPRAAAPWARSADDLIMLYTGGTTGAPKGVLWRQDDVFAILNASAAIRYRADRGLAGVAATQREDRRARPRFVPCGPLVHGTAAFSSYAVLGAGGAVILLEGRSFDAAGLLDVIDREQVSQLSIIGEAHARPVIDQLEARPGHWSLSSVRLITSAGMQLSRETRGRLLAHMPRALCVDVLGSSEAPSVGLARSTVSSLAPSGAFAIGPGVAVLDEDDKDVRPGSGAVGVLAVKGGRSPLGYYKDPERTRRLFATVDGERWVITGDLATVGADGTVQLLGRGTTVINTGGEKVYAREVEEALMRNPAVADAVVAGIPHEVLGQMVVALVQPRRGALLDTADLIAELRQALAAYKVPRQIHIAESVGRSDNGKVDYPRLVRRLSELTARERRRTNY
jgi:acyl-CoA synthetase (AMP-forming)/AMP-acid ligase II